LPSGFIEGGKGSVGTPQELERLLVVESVSAFRSRVHIPRKISRVAHRILGSILGFMRG